MLLRFSLFHPFRWTAAARLGAISAVIVAIAVGLTAWKLVQDVQATMIAQGQNALEINLKLAHELLRLKGGDGPLQLQNDHLVIVNGHALDGDQEVVDKVREIVGGTATVFRGDLRVSTNVMKPDGSRAIGTRLAAGPVHDAVLRDGQTYRGEVDILGTTYFTVYEPLKNAQGSVIGILYVGVKKSEFLSIVYSIEKVAALTGSILMVLGGGALLLAVRRTFRPLDALRETMSALVAGNLATPVPAAGRLDEIGRMASAVQVFKDGLITARRADEEKRIEQAAAERRQQAMNQHTQDFGASISGVMSSLASAADTIRQSVETMSQAGSAVHEKAGGTAVSAVQSSEQLAAVAAAVEQMTASIEGISQQVAAASEVARQAVLQAEAGQSSIKGLSDATSRIGHVVNLISSIAGQTNLLALNATIEAARAGDAGKGFAVVAGEVKILAAQTTKATGEIGDQIAAIQSATEDAVTAMGQIGGIITKMEHVSAAIASAVEEQGVTTRAIATSVQSVASSLDTTAQSMHQVVDSADDVSKVGHLVHDGADEISRQATTLNVEVDQFLKAIQADKHDRRNYERINGNGLMATITVPGREAAKVPVKDISESGIAVLCDWTAPAGTQVEIILTGNHATFMGRVTRSITGGMGILFRQDNAMLQQVSAFIREFRRANAA